MRYEFEGLLEGLIHGAFFRKFTEICPVVLNPGRDTKQELSKNWSEDYTTKQLRDRPHLSSNNRAIRRRR